MSRSKQGGIQKSFIMSSDALKIINGVKIQHKYDNDSQALRKALEMLNESSLLNYKEIGSEKKSKT